MDALTLQTLWQRLERREREAQETLARWALASPAGDPGGPEAVTGPPLISLPPAQLQALAQAAAPREGDADAERRRLEELRQGARRAQGARDVAVQLEHCRFLLERVSAA